jgi:hypothetical protein
MLGPIGLLLLGSSLPPTCYSQLQFYGWGWKKVPNSNLDVKNIFAESYAERILSVGGDAIQTNNENVEAGVQSSNLVSPQIAWTNIAYNFQSISLSSSIHLSIIIHPLLLSSF